MLNFAHLVFNIASFFTLLLAITQCRQVLGYYTRAAEQPAGMTCVQLFRQRLFHNSVNVHATMAIGVMGCDSLALIAKRANDVMTQTRLRQTIWMVDDFEDFLKGRSRCSWNTCETKFRLHSLYSPQLSPTESREDFSALHSIFRLRGWGSRDLARRKEKAWINTFVLFPFLSLKYHNFRHCRVCFYAFGRQPFSKQLPVNKQGDMRITVFSCISNVVCNTFRINVTSFRQKLQFTAWCDASSSTHSI